MVTRNELLGIKTHVFQEMEYFVMNNGPEPEAYSKFNALVKQIGVLLDHNTIHPSNIEEFKARCNFLNDPKSLIGHIKIKPYGYAGDFYTIDRLYTQQIVMDTYKKWDEYTLQHPAAIAVRNRKAYFKALVARKIHTPGTLSLLNVASGPARDIKEAYTALDQPEKLKTTCVEMDKNAISYAMNVNGKYGRYIQFIHKNIFRFQCDRKFDLIWSAGLFDYFDDKVFARVLNRFKHWIKPGGELVIGNFNEDHNPSRAYMEIFGAWYLHHRTAEQLIALAKQAGFKEGQLTLKREPENINLFLHIQIKSEGSI